MGSLSNSMPDADSKHVTPRTLPQRGSGMDRDEGSNAEAKTATAVGLDGAPYGYERVAWLAVHHANFSGSEQWLEIWSIPQHSEHHGLLCFSPLEGRQRRKETLIPGNDETVDRF